MVVDTDIDKAMFILAFNPPAKMQAFLLPSEEGIYISGCGQRYRQKWVGNGGFTIYFFTFVVSTFACVVSAGAAAAVAASSYKLPCASFWLGGFVPLKVLT